MDWGSFAWGCIAGGLVCGVSMFLMVRSVYRDRYRVSKTTADRPRRVRVA